MVQETIRAVKEAEEQAEKKLQETKAQCDGILKKAKEDAVAAQDAAKKEALGQADAAMGQAQAKGREILDESLRMAEKEIAALKALAAEKEEKAVNVIISELV